MPSFATLTTAVRESIQIESFIYHIIRQDEEEPSYNDEVTLSSEQKTFFEERIRAACDGTQFSFTDPENNNCKIDCDSILSDVANNFVPTSRLLTSRFFEAHNRSMNEGVFIVAVISVLINNSRKQLLSFLKVDYSTVFQQKVQNVDGRQVVTLTKVMDSLADSPKALQKWAIVDPSDLFIWDALALQRNTPNDKKDTDIAISGYFKAFLQVKARQTPSALTKESVSETRKWAQSLSELPEGISRSDFKARAINYFENTDQFNTENYINQVLGSYVEEGMTDAEKQEILNLRSQHEASLRNALSEAGIAGQTFESMPSSIPSNSRKNVLKTSTGVTVAYQGTRAQNNISVTTDGPEQVITIRTVQLDEA